MDLQKQILNAVNLALFDRAVLSCKVRNPQEAIYALSKKQNITALVAEGLRRSGDYEKLIPEFDRLSEKYLFQYAQQSVESERMIRCLEERNYPYILLKGAKMRHFYPQPHLRTSCDIDILTRQSDETVFEMMNALGYKFTVDGGTTLNFEKPPTVEFEMHRCLFLDQNDFSGYFNDIWERSVPAGEGRAERLLTEEDFYVYMIAHIAKHIDKYGCGIRPFIDVYLYHQKRPAAFDRSKADAILQKINLLAFERRICALTQAWFETGNLTEADKKLTDFLFGAGLYGNAQLSAAHNVRKKESRRKGRMAMYMRHIFPPLWIMRPMYPRLLKWSVFLPLAWVLRWFRLLFFGRKKATAAIRRISRTDDQYMEYVDSVIREFGLKEDG